MLSVINEKRVYDELDELILIECFRKNLSILGDDFVLPSFTILDGYALILTSFYEAKQQLQFNGKYMFKLNLDKMNMLGDFECLDAIRICSFDEFKRKFKDVGYTIKGVDDSLTSISKIADYEIISAISEEHMDRILAFGIDDYTVVSKRSDINGYSVYYEKTVLAARKLLEAIQSESNSKLVESLVKRMSLEYILFLSYAGFCAELLESVIAVSEQVPEDLNLSTHMLDLNYDNLMTVIND